ncbi:MAG: heme exporter protein CcmD [Gammaproteobacteria bacterium]|nr:heme exporter protein CcmD [Gammaproteobacteria bacterium]
MSFHEFYTMGGYAAYVWPAFAVAAVTLGLQWLLAQRYQQKIHRKIKEYVQS